MSIEKIPPNEARRRSLLGVVLIDVRQEYERATGQAESAVSVEQTSLTTDPNRYLPTPTSEAMLICQSGRRSLDAAQALYERGYTGISTVAGGTLAWIREGLPMVRPVFSSQSQDFIERYSRQLALPQIGHAGQSRLTNARVLLVGAGGLGSPVALYLAAAGVGRIRLVDDDLVERSNLQRQILHTDADVGVAKVISAARRIRALNPAIDIEAINARVTADNVRELLRDVDAVVDGADNFSTRYLLNEACVRLAKPLIYGAVHQFSGQVSVFDAGRQPGIAPCYCCLFPHTPAAQFTPNCTAAGVLGVVPGLIGLLQSTEVLKLLLDIGEPLIGRVLNVDTLTMRLHETRLLPDPDCTICTKAETPQLT